MNYIREISDLYQGNIMLHSPYAGDWGEDFPKEIRSILQVSNGIEETVLHPKTGEQIPVMWILYPYEEIERESAFYQREYGLEGLIFADDGAGNPYVLKPDGTITCYCAMDNEEIKTADSLADFYAVPASGRPGSCL